MDATLVRAIASHRAGDLAAAEAGYRAVLAAREDDDALGNLGLILWRRGDLAEAEAALARAVALRPDKPGLHYNLGSFLWRSRRLDEAATALQAALDLDPAFTNARVNLGNVYLAQGRYAEGWPLYDARDERRQSEAHKLGFPEWQGEPLTGKRLFVWTEQGLGDQIFAARFLPRLVAREVTVVCTPSLARLFAQLPVRVVPRGPTVDVPPHDYWILPMSLARWVGGTIPADPYLSGAGPRTGGFGVAWKGNPKPDPGRSLPPELGAELLALPGARNLIPQDGAGDFQDTADLIAGLDLVVTIDTAAAHLAGAMGKPTVLLLQHHASDWRWIEGAPARSALYPSIEIWRQPAPGDWRTLIERVKARLGVAGIA